MAMKMVHFDQGHGTALLPVGQQASGEATHSHRGEARAISQRPPPIGPRSKHGLLDAQM